MNKTLKEKIDELTGSYEGRSIDPKDMRDTMQRLKRDMAVKNLKSKEKK